MNQKKVFIVTSLQICTCKFFTQQMEMIMEKTGYYIYPTVPGSMDAFRWDSQGRTIKDVALNNAEVDRLGIAQMTVNATSVAAISEDNSEHTILKYKDQYQLTLHGIATGRSTRTSRIMKLAPGTYTKLRFYINGKISYLSETKEERGIYGLEYVDFEFESPLEVKGNESPEFILRFNFIPFKSKSWFGNLKKLKPIQWPTAKWA